MQSDRRRVLQAGIAALAWPALVGIPTLARAQATARFVPPAGPMRYTRQLTRQLGKDAAFSVMRSFAITFVSVDGGYEVRGQQIEVAVDAPETLARFAQLERERFETGLFPITLNPAGRIAGGPSAPVAKQLDAAVQEAIRQFDKKAFAPDARAELNRFVATVQQNAAQLMTELPRDLFAPEQASQTTVQAVPLPGGEAGEVRVRFEAQINPLTGLMQQAIREVVTDLSGDQRRAIETWQLAIL